MRYGPEERWADWSAWFEDAYQDVMALTFNRLVWRNLVAMLQANTNVEHHSHINDYLTRSYAQMQAVGIRRQWDRKERRPTIGRVLHELTLYPAVASRTRFHAELTHESHVGWLAFSPEDGDAADPVVMSEDLVSLDVKTSGARDYVNRRVAHIARDHREGSIGSGDWFGDLNSGIDVLADLIRKYWTLFHPGNVLASVTPALDLGSFQMFRTAWMPEGFHPIEPEWVIDLIDR